MRGGLQSVKEGSLRATRRALDELVREGKLRRVRLPNGEEAWQDTRAPLEPENVVIKEGSPSGGPDRRETRLMFGAPMMRALLARRKTQTRRPIRGRHVEPHVSATLAAKLCPYGQPGDFLLACEAFRLVDVAGMDDEGADASAIVEYAADGARIEHHLGYWPPETGVMRVQEKRWHAARFMPKWASRIKMEIVGVRVERLGSISHEDVVAEGTPWERCEHPECNPTSCPGWKDHFLRRWDAIYKKPEERSGTNPFVFALSLREAERKGSEAP